MSHIYLKILGIAGNVSAKSYENWIAVNHFEFKTVKHLAMLVGRQADRFGARAAFSEFHIMKKRDVASPLLFSHLLSNRVFDQMEIHKITTANTLTSTEKYLLSDVIISHFEASSSGDFELIQLNYTKFEMSYTGRNSANKLGSPLRSGYDLPSAELC